MSTFANRRIDRRPLMEAVEGRRLLSSSPTVNISAYDSTAYRDSHSAGIFVVTRSGDLSDPLTVPLVVGGTAANGTDYGKVGSEVTIPAGQRSVAVPIRAASNMDKSEYVTLSLGTFSAITTLANYKTSVNSATVEVLSNSSSTAPVIQGVTLEKVSSVKYVLERTDDDPTTTLTVPISLGGTGVNGVDFGIVGNAVTFRPGVFSVTLMIRQTASGIATGAAPTVALTPSAGATTSTSTGTSTDTGTTTDTGTISTDTSTNTAADPVDGGLTTTVGTIPIGVGSAGGVGLPNDGGGSTITGSGTIDSGTTGTTITPTTGTTTGTIIDGTSGTITPINGNAGTGLGSLGAGGVLTGTTTDDSIFGTITNSGTVTFVS